MNNVDLMADLDSVISTADKEKLLEILQIQSPVAIAQLAERSNAGYSLLHHICKLGYADVAQILITHGADIDKSSPEGSPVQIACKYGHVDIVEYLCSIGVVVCLQLWSPDSLHYIASANGDIEMVNLLLKIYPGEPRGSDVISCLVYAACLGGTFDVVTTWLTPRIDINSPVSIVTTLAECENQTPLHAACQNGHVKLAKHLHSIGAFLTEHICSTFPGIVLEILEDGVEILEINDGEEDQQRTPNILHNIEWNRYHLCSMTPFLLMPYMETVVSLNLAKNKLRSLPSCIPWSMCNLHSLRLSGNELRDISPPASSIACQKLTELFLNLNCLETICYELFQIQTLKELNLSNNRLSYLVSMNKDHQSADKAAWNCPKLDHLDVSHNRLVMLPTEIRSCSGLTHLFAKNNRLTCFPSGWTCNMALLDVSYNCLDKCPSSIEAFWATSLKHVKLDHNLLEEVNESLVKLNVLTDLTISHNKLESLPSQDVWDCRQLCKLDLSHNKLGHATANEELQSTSLSSPVSPVIKAIFGTPSVKEDVALPDFKLPSFLGDCLREFYLSYNNLKTVPASVCQLTSLHILDISENPAIKILPPALGNLKQCSLLKVDKLVNITNVPLKVMTGTWNRTRDILAHLCIELRKSRPYMGLKCMIMGPEGGGKSSIVSLLKGNQEMHYYPTPGLDLHEIKLNDPSKKKAPEISLNIWDLSGNRGYMVTHSSMITPNALFLLVFNLQHWEKRVNLLWEWLCCIQASVPGAHVLMVGTFLDMIPTKHREREVGEIEYRIKTLFSKKQPQSISPKIVGILTISCATKENLNQLKQKVYHAALEVPDSSCKNQKLIGRMVPRSYIQLETVVRKIFEDCRSLGRRPIMSEKEFFVVVETVSDNDITTSSELTLAVKFLKETGTLLHFNDQLHDLNNLYFIDPVWLCNMMSKIVISQNLKAKTKGGFLSMSDAETILSRDESFPKDYFSQYVQLLEKFEIALQHKGQRLFIPSALSDTRPGMDLDEFLSDNTNKIFRLYKMAYVPSGLWSRLLTRIMLSMERLTAAQLSESHLGLIRPSSSFIIKKKKTIYWREGVMVSYDGGYFIVEAACPDSRDLASEFHQGILITVQSLCNDYSTMSYVIDEIDDIINDMYPGLVDEDEFGDRMLTSIAICQNCYPNIQELDSNMLKAIDHFRVESCLRSFMTSDTIQCPHGHRVSLKQLVPEMLMTNLSKRLFVDEKKLHFEMSTESYLGDGASAKVYKGRYGDQNVAIKQFHMLTMTPSTATPSTDSGISLENNEEKRFSEELQETLESRQLMSCFSEMRREVAILSRLQHPCIMTLIGISLRPLYMVLELAPLGSLRNLIDEQSSGKKSFNKYRDKGKVFPALLPKNLTYKIIFQIAKALQYLHRNDIIYRDLKSENILVWSTDTDAPINIKVSDYGISKFTTPQGLQGFAGTPGFQAPEILRRLAYDEKVDIFSFAMVIYEVLSGRLPYSDCGSIAEPIDKYVISGKRPALQDYNIDSGFPYLNSVMTKCWSADPNQRPSAADVTRMMLNTEFLCQENIVENPDNGVMSHADCTMTYIASEDKTDRLIWIWEGSGRYRRYHILDSKHNQFRVFGEVCQGPLVTCMARVDNTLWVGTEDCEIEVYSSMVVGNPGCQQRIRAKSRPLALVYQARVGTEIGSKQTTRAYAAMDNGTLAIFSPESLSAASYGPSKILTLPSRDPASCMTLVNDETEIWVACGSTISVISTRTLMVERKIDALPSITALLHVDKRVFCSVKDECIIVEYDSTDYMRTCVFNLKETGLQRRIVVRNDTAMHLHHDDVEDDGSCVVNTSNSSTDKDVTSDVSDDQLLQLPPKITSRHITSDTLVPAITNSGTDKDVTSDVSFDQFPPILSKIKGIASDTSVLTTTDTDTDVTSDVSVDQPPQLPPKVTSMRTTRDTSVTPITNIATDNDVTSDVSVDQSPPIPPKIRGITSDTSVLTITNSGTDKDVTSDVSVDQPLQLPPKIITRRITSDTSLSTITNKDKGVSLNRAKLDDVVVRVKNITSLPRNVKLLESEVRVAEQATSVLLVNDTLWVARSSGDIIVVNINRSEPHNFMYGEVLAVLTGHGWGKYCTQNYNPQLVLCKDIVVAAIDSQKHRNVEQKVTTELSMWRGYGTDKINEFNEFARSLKLEEMDIIIQ